MPKTLYLGATGSDVRTLQEKLNLRSPTALERLAVDGIFGPRTLARVREFQGLSHLDVDGIVGPKTWEALLEVPVPRKVPPRVGCDCGNAYAENRGLCDSIKALYLSSRPASASPGPPRRTFGLRTAAFTARSGATQAAASGSSPVRMLTPSQQAKARSVFGESLDFSKIFITDKSGLGNRPFTVAFPDRNETVQIINAGSFTPSDRVLIHELAHVWQSQHHSDPYRFMSNAVECQAKAVVANGKEVFSDPDVLLHKDHPVQFPFSAYAYKPGLPFSEYAAEQMANSVEQGEAPIRSHVSKVARNAVDPDNVAAMKKIAFADRRASGVKY